MATSILHDLLSVFPDLKFHLRGQGCAAGDPRVPTSPTSGVHVGEGGQGGGGTAPYFLDMFAP